MKLMTSAIVRKSSFFLLGGMTAAAGWAVFAAGNIFENLNNNPLPQGNNPVAVHAATPAQNTGGVATMPFATTSHLRRTANRSTSAPSVVGDRPAALPSAAMRSTSIFAHGGAVAVSHTGSRTANTGGYNASAQMHSTVEDAKRVGTSSFGGNMLALASATMITAPGATNAGSVASMQVNTAVTPGPRKIGGLPGYNEDPVTDPPTPVGPTPFIFMALLAAVYGVYIAIRRTKSQS